MTLQDYNRRRKKAAQARRKKAQYPYKVVVYKKADFLAVEIKRFSTYSAAEDYANMYAGGGTFGAYIE